MWHEDILVWQSATQATVLNPSSSPGGVQLCIQDPSRVLLIITSLCPADAYLGLAKMVPPIAGIMMGERVAPVSLGGVMDLRTQGINDGGYAITGVIDPTTGDTVLGAVAQQGLAFLQTVNLGPNGTGTYGLDGTVNFPAAPRVREWRWPEHGVLPKLAWFAWDNFGSGAFHVLSVTMQNRPCPTWRLGNGDHRSRMRLQGGNQPVRRGGHVLDALAWPQCQAPGADLLPDESQ